MLRGMRSVLGLIGLVGGAATAIIGLISVLGQGSWSDFLFWVGIAYLACAGASLVLIVGRSATRSVSTTEELTPASDSALDNVAEAVLLGLLAITVAAVAWEVLNWARGLPLDVHGNIEALGFAGILMFVILILIGWNGIVSFIRESSQLSRPCPRCGHSVRAGVMQCPSCEFDFWSVGRDAY